MRPVRKIFDALEKNEPGIYIYIQVKHCIFNFVTFTVVDTIPCI